jgi:hypothetical protein
MAQHAHRPWSLCPQLAGGAGTGDRGRVQSSPPTPKNHGGSAEEGEGGKNPSQWCDVGEAMGRVRVVEFTGG